MAVVERDSFRETIALVLAAGGYHWRVRRFPVLTMCAQHPADQCRMRDCHEHGQKLTPRDRPEWPHVPIKPTQ